MNTIQIKNLNYSIDGITIFKDFNMKIEENSFVSIAGNNTSGKTTLIKLIAGLLPNNDTITIGYSYLNPNRLYDHSKDLGVVLGSNLESFLFSDVYKEMAFSLENLCIDPKEIETRIIKIAKFFEINKLLDKKTYDLTNSEKQVLLIAISLLHEPKTLLLDCPFTMMDKTTKEKVKAKLKEYKEEHDITIVMTTTNLEDTLESDYLYIINKGNVVIEGKPLIVLKEDSLLKKLGLEIPRMVDLSLKLKFYEVLDDIELDLDRMVNTLWK